MTVATLTLSLIALAVAALAMWVAARAHDRAVEANRQIARHRHSHAERAAEQPAARHSGTPGPPPAVSDDGPSTEQLAIPDLSTQARPAVRLPRPGQIGAQVPAVDE